MTAIRMLTVPHCRGDGNRGSTHKRYEVLLIRDKRYEVLLIRDKRYY